MRLPVVTAALMLVCVGGMVWLQDLRQHAPAFLVLYGLAYLAYTVAAAWSLRQPAGRSRLALILGVAVLLRAMLLFGTPPTLSDDVYRYIWDGRMVNAGINPYAYAVDAPALDRLATPLRQLVNHAHMASPYLPVAQVYFAAIYRLAPDSPLAFQVGAALLDLLAGCLVLDLLRCCGLPPTRGLIYLWNPLVVVEFAQGAHVDALMICLMLVGLELWVRRRSRWPSVIALAAATMTKGLPMLIVPLVAWRWRLRHMAAYGALLVGACLAAVLGAGWGWSGPLDGVGLFGALRIYGATWSHNAGLYHWLEISLVWLCGSFAAPQAILAARLAISAALALILFAVWREGRGARDEIALLRLMVIPLAAYLLLTPTLHPWYATLLLPFLPFLPTYHDDPARGTRWLWAWLYLGWAVSLSYLTYLDPAHPREYPFVRLIEYSMLYLLLVWAAWPTVARAVRSGREILSMRAPRF